MTVEDRFWEKVDIGDDEECWEWMAYRHNGYGHFGLNGKIWRAHRVAWLLTYGEIPEGTCVLHRCDNPPCVNPAHLFLGTQADNNADTMAKGHFCSADRRGERSGSSKLTETEVLEIRRLWAETNLRQCKIAEQFGVSGTTISNIVHNKMWTHI